MVDTIFILSCIFHPKRTCILENYFTMQSKWWNTTFMVSCILLTNFLIVVIRHLYKNGDSCSCIVWYPLLSKALLTPRRKWRQKERRPWEFEPLCKKGRVTVRFKALRSQQEKEIENLECVVHCAKIRKRRSNLQNSTFLSLYHKNNTQKLKWPK